MLAYFFNFLENKMKKIFTIISSLFLFAAAFAVDSSYFVDGKSGKGLTVKVEPTTTRTLKSGDIGYSDMVDMQNKIISLISNYSEISVVTEQARQSAVNELRTSQSSLFDEESAIEVGNFKAASYIISSTMNLAASENSNYRRYVLSLQVTNTETGSLVWSSNNPAKHTQHDFSTGVALNEQGVELLTALGVALSETGKQKVTNLNINQVNREQALARASSAATQVEKLYYGYDAANYGASNAELIQSNNELAALLKAAKSSGSVKDAAQTEKAVFEAYKKNLEEVDSFFTENPPYKIVYDNSISSSTYLDRNDNVLTSITTHIVAYPTTATKQLIELFRDGIKATGSDSIVSKRYSDWPLKLNSVWRNANNFTVKLELSDDKGNVLSSASVRLPASKYEKIRRTRTSDYGTYYTYDFSWPSEMASVEFRDINPDDITDKLVIEIVGIYGWNTPYDLSQFQIRTAQEYIDERIKEINTEKENKQKEYEAADKANKQKGRSMFSLNLIGGFRDDIQEPVGLSVTSAFEFGNYIFGGADLGVLNFHTLSEDFILDLFFNGYIGVNKYFTPKFCLFAEIGFSMLGLDLNRNFDAEDFTYGVHLGAGADFLFKSDFDAITGLYSKDGITAKLSLDYDFISEKIIPIVSLGYGFGF